MNLVAVRIQGVEAEKPHLVGIGSGVEAHAPPVTEEPSIDGNLGWAQRNLELKAAGDGEHHRE